MSNELKMYVTNVLSKGGNDIIARVTRNEIMESLFVHRKLIDQNNFIQMNPQEMIIMASIPMNPSLFTTYVRMENG